MLLFAVVATLASASHDDACHGQATCEDITPMDAARAAALMQVKTDPVKAVLAQSPDPVTLQQSGHCAPASLQEGIHLEESRDCIPAELQEMHFQAVRRHAALLAAQTRRHAALLAAHAQMRKEKEVKPGKQGPQPPPLEDMTLPPTTTKSKKTKAALVDKVGPPPSLEDLTTPTTTTEGPATTTEAEADEAQQCFDVTSVQVGHGWISGEYDLDGCREQCDLEPTCDGWGAHQLGGTCFLYSRLNMCQCGASGCTSANNGYTYAKKAPATTTEAPATEGPTKAPTRDPTDPRTEAPTRDPTDPRTEAPPSGGADGESDVDNGDDGAAVPGVADGGAPVSGTGASAPLDKEGFKQATSLCCPQEMEVFFSRLLESMGYESCSWPHIQGLMHWFTCVPDMDFQYMVDVIEKGNPCMYWAKKGEQCAVLTPECAGHFCR